MRANFKFRGKEYYTRTPLVIIVLALILWTVFIVVLPFQACFWLLGFQGPIKRVYRPILQRYQQDSYMVKNSTMPQSMVFDHMELDFSANMWRRN